MASGRRYDPPTAAFGGTSTSRPRRSSRVRQWYDLLRVQLVVEGVVGFDETKQSLMVTRCASSP